MESACAIVAQRVLKMTLSAVLLSACSTAPARPAVPSSSHEPPAPVLVLASSFSSESEVGFIPIFDDEEPDDEDAYTGPLSWHINDFDEVVTDKLSDRRFRNKSVSAAHCYFADAPNKDTPIFALIIRHTQHRGDVLYLGRHNMVISRLDTVPLTDRRRSPLKLELDPLHCLYRDDQHELGALIFSFRYVDRPEQTPKFAAVMVEMPNVREPTDEILTVPDPKAGRSITHTPTIEVRAERYVSPEGRILGVFDDFEAALAAVEASLPSGRFRLRPENVYPYMSWQSYLDGSSAEFCPANTECRERTFDVGVQGIEQTSQE
jgi:hypothetical protein